MKKTETVKIDIDKLYKKNIKKIIKEDIEEVKYVLNKMMNSNGEVPKIYEDYANLLVSLMKNQSPLYNDLIDNYLININKYIEKIIHIDNNIEKHKEKYNKYLKRVLSENSAYLPVEFINTLKEKNILDEKIVLNYIGDIDADEINSKNNIARVIKENIFLRVSKYSHNDDSYIIHMNLLEDIYNKLILLIHGKNDDISKACVKILDKIYEYVSFFPKKDIDKSYVDYYFKSFLDLGNNITYDNTKLIDFKLKDYFNDMITTIKEENKITKQSLEVKIISIKDIEKDDYVYLVGDEVPIIDILNMPLISFDYIIPKYKDIVISKENYICLVNALNKHAYKFIYDNLNNQDKDLLKNMFSNNRSSLNEPVVQIGKNVNKIEKLIVEINKLLGKDYMYDGKNKDKLLLNLFDCYKNNEDILYRLIFIYFVMYEKKGMNMRNKCTHGYHFNKCCFFEEVCTFICLNELEVIKKGCIK